MPDRQEHLQEVRSFLQKHLSIHDWFFSLPHGSGMETYFAQGNGQDYFVKVGAPVERYLAIAEIGLTPSVLVVGQLESGLSIMVQRFITGRSPSQIDYRDQLEKVAAVIHKMQHHPRIKGALNHLRQKWNRDKAQIPTVAEFVENGLEYLNQHVNLFSSAGLVASHNDICNANWLFTSDREIYIVDFESMSMDDPALDMGALLWWYYPPELRRRFLDILRYPHNDEFKFRMQVRMAMHCLNIILPRVNSFDVFDPGRFSKSLRDFKAVLDGKENPEGYGG